VHHTPAALFLAVFLAAAGHTTLPAQNDPSGRSKIIETVDSIRYYLHFVREGETVTSLAGLYGIELSDLYHNNPDALGGVKAGDLLKIPCSLAGPEVQKQSFIAGDTAFFYHIVKKKETLYSISRKYSVKIDAIRNHNPGLADILPEGQYLKIPVNKEIPRTNEKDGEPSPFIRHTVVKGETLYGLARKYGVTIGEIINNNPGTRDTIRIGQSLNIPDKDAIPDSPPKPKVVKPDYQEHIVAPGETLYQLARRYALGIDSLKKANPGLTEEIRPGQVIRIPARMQGKDYITHVSTEKEKLDRIAKNYDVDVEKVREINPGVRDRTDRGQVVKIPVEQATTKDETMETPADTVAEVSHEEPPEGPPCESMEGMSRKIFNVALMIPMFLYELDSVLLDDPYHPRVPEENHPFRFLQFYEGFLIAMDSMTSVGFRVNLFVYDVDFNTAKTAKVLLRSELSDMDLIIGPFFNKSFEMVADFARTFEINIVNPLSERNEVTNDNPFVFKLKPDPDASLDQLAAVLSRMYPHANIVIVRPNEYQFHDESIQLTQMLDEYAVKQVVYSTSGLSGLKSQLSLSKDNIVVAFTGNSVLAQDLLTKLNPLRGQYIISLVGLPNWEEYPNLDVKNMINLNYHGISQAYVDYSDENVKSFVTKYRNRFKTEPQTGNFAFDGFDAGWYFLNALNLYGKRFERCIHDMNVKLIQNHFVFSKTANGGYLNIYWNIYMYQGYDIVNLKK
jgi:LysM repeat protein